MGRGYLLGTILVAGGFLLFPTLAQACGAVDLRLDKSGPSSAQVGGQIIYTFTVTQLASGIANSVAVYDKIPAGLTFNPGASYKSCRISGDSVLCLHDVLSSSGSPFWAKMISGQSWTFSIGFDVTENPPNCEVNNIATVASNETRGNPHSSNTVNTQVQCVTVTPPPTPEATPTQPPEPTPTPEITPTPPPGLKILKSDRGRVLTRPDDGFAYDLTVTNTGEVDLSDAVVTDTVPGQFKIIGVSKGGSVQGQLVKWKLSHLSPGQSTKVTITVQTRSDVADTKEVCNVGKVTGNGLADQSKDCLAIEHKQVKAATIVKPKQVPVKVTAKTGGGLGMIATSLFSGFGWTVFRVIRSRRSF